MTWAQRVVLRPGLGAAEHVCYEWQRRDGGEGPGAEHAELVSLTYFIF